MPTIPCSRARSHTDVSYLACMRLHAVRPARVLSAVRHPQRALDRRRAASPRPRRDAYEFQRLHGMGEARLRGGGRRRQAGRALPHLRAGRAARGPGRLSGAAPAGERRQHLLRQPPGRRGGAGRGDRARSRRDRRARDGARQAASRCCRGRRRSSRPSARNSRGMALDRADRARRRCWREIAAELDGHVRGRARSSTARTLAAAARPSWCCARTIGASAIGTVRTADAADDRGGASRARAAAAHAWDRLGGPARAAILERAADLYERDRVRLMAVMVREAGKTLDNALGDVREAIDFLRYYAAEARRLFAGAGRAQGPDRRDQHAGAARAAGRSPASRPWNFPLAIFTGQVAAALAAGNPVLAKPAEQTPIVAFLADAAAARGRRAARRAAAAAGRRRGRRRAGQGPARGGRRLHRLQRDRLGHPAARWPTRRGAIVPFIAETGGLNAMIANSSALPEQVIRDVVRSAFDSAGQRCSAARLFFVQEDVAKPMIDMLVGAVRGARYRRSARLRHRHRPRHRRGRAWTGSMRTSCACRSRARELVDLPLPDACEAGTYVDAGGVRDRRRAAS